MKVLAAALALILSLSLAEGVMVCYYGSWAVYRQGDGKFDVEDIDPGICTHIVFGFAGLGSDNKIKVLDPWNELCDNYGKCAFDRFTALKHKNTKLQALLAVGGWNEGSQKYSQMAADASKRQAFITSTVEMIKEHNFDGLDLDWEYPTQRGGAPEDKVNFITLMQELKVALHAEGFLLTVAVSAGKETFEEAYDIAALAQEVDLINLMSYDLHGAWEDYTHHQSGLYMYPEDTGDNIYLNQDYAVNAWINGGMPSTKIALGVPMYGRCWSLDNEAEHGYYAPASQPGPSGPFTNSPGFMGYNEICDKIQTDGWTVEVAPGANEPYAYHMPTSRIWCSYDDEASVAAKDPSVTTTPPRTTPNTPPPEGVCQAPGINPDPDNCHHYWLCSQSSAGTHSEGVKMCRLVMLLTLGALMGAGASGEVPSPRENQEDYPLPPLPGNKGLDFCNALVARFKERITTDISGVLLEPEWISTKGTLSTSSGPISVPIRLGDFRLRNLDGVMRLGAGTLEDTTVECGLHFPKLDVFTRYRAIIPPEARLPRDVAAGYLTLDANITAEFSAIRNPDNVLDELKDISVHKPAVSNFEAPRLNRVNPRNKQHFTDMLRDAVESAITRLIEDMSEVYLKGIIPSVTPEQRR
ncbi:hypothetical protein Pcinc_044422 [Petrolisthes cinctipes]|uniref:GH18 domain-containing protein n=1 Tax=Petrolisthes cinctipes TaxID=88211 RepID=A0AAE1EFB5_PETCI|nr:hypothetical protein Pcinc_044422 [Petrolisthes cinctipes]